MPDQLDPTIESLSLEKKREILEAIYTVRQDYADKEIAATRWMCSGVAALLLLLFSYYSTLQRLGFPKEAIVAVLVCLGGALFGLLYAHAATVDFYRQCGEFRIQVKLGSLHLTKLAVTVKSNWVASYCALGFSSALIGIAGAVTIFSYAVYVR
jgi:hypothetical protein